ncbi:HSP20 family molecular chaperone IbpA [Evansella vedderi]|uniref:HSP20 family molecular chaperone IbpA n=1 Tax=Evansella vedderi TaxID=38282 RepID=A0ABT9ZZ53_9BACI|nr:Hsp20 family protein [Evansella vedderi]MDQ0256529.1 HSP20 family molecular chaperone IbpA [Evansella vedderi]
MVNRNQPMGLFNFPFFGPAPEPPVRLDVRQTETELIIEATFPEFEKEHIKVELVRSGVLIVAEKPVERGEGEEETSKTVQTTRIERFVPVHFPFGEEDITATFSEDNVLKVVITKNDAHRKFIPIK